MTTPLRGFRLKSKPTAAQALRKDTYEGLLALSNALAARVRPLERQVRLLAVAVLVEAVALAWVTLAP